MNALVSLLRLILWPARQLKRLLGLQVRLQRRGRRFRLVLGELPPAAKPAAHRPAQRRPARQAPAVAEAAPAVDDATADMQRELHELLAQHTQTRHLMRHLAYLERALKLSGASALDQPPLEVLQKALAQLEELVSDWSTPGLAELRLRLTMAVADKEDAAAQAAASATAAAPRAKLPTRH